MVHDKFEYWIVCLDKQLNTSSKHICWSCYGHELGVEPTDSLQTKRSTGRAMGTNERVEPTDSLQTKMSTGRATHLWQQELRGSEASSEASQMLSPLQAGSSPTVPEPSCAFLPIWGRGPHTRMAWYL